MARQGKARQGKARQGNSWANKNAGAVQSSDFRALAALLGVAVGLVGMQPDGRAQPEPTSAEDVAPAEGSPPPAVDMALSHMKDEANRNWETAPAEVRSGAVDEVTATGSPMQVRLSPQSSLPTFVGGPGFAVGDFDLTDDPLGIVAQVFSRWNFLEMADPDAELALFRDHANPVTRALVFRQVFLGVPILESRLTFVFDGEGRLVYYGGEYFPPALAEVNPSSTGCGSLLGHHDDLGYEIVGCRDFYSQSERNTGVADGAMYPVFEVQGLSLDGHPVTSYFSEATGNFERPWDFEVAHRWVYRPYPPHSDTFKSYMVDEDCKWDDHGYGPCIDADYNRITDNLWYYWLHMAYWHQRYAWNGECTPSSCDPYWAMVDDDIASPAWSGGRAWLDRYSRISTLGHEFSHGVLNSEAGDTYGGIGDALADTYGNVLAQAYAGWTGHWCYHNYPDWDMERECVMHHITKARCTMLSGDTVGARPFKNHLLDKVESPMPGISWNIMDPALADHESGGAYSKAFELFNLDRWIDPNAGTPTSLDDCEGTELPYYVKPGAPVTYFNGFALSGAVSLYKTAQLWYRFVTTYASGLGQHPWATFGANFSAAAWGLYYDGVLTASERNKALYASRAAGHTTGSSTIPGHYGTRYRQAAFRKNNETYLFYARPSNNRIVYQRQLSNGTWTTPVEFANTNASTTMGLDAYDLANGDTRIIFRHAGSTNVYYVMVYADGTVPTTVWSFSYLGCPQTSTYAPAGIVDAGIEYVVTTSSIGHVSVTRIGTCQTNASTGIPTVKGVSLAKWNGNIFLVGTVQPGQGTWSNHQFVARYDSSLNQFVHLPSYPLPTPPDEKGYVTCASYNLGNCFAYTNSSGTTPNLFGVTMPSGRESFARLYLAWASLPADFRMTRLWVDQATRNPSKRTRILPFDSGDVSNRSEPELLQVGSLLYVFEHNKQHFIWLY